MYNPIAVRPYILILESLGGCGCCFCGGCGELAELSTNPQKIENLSFLSFLKLRYKDERMRNKNGLILDLV